MFPSYAFSFRYRHFLLVPSYFLCLQCIKIRKFTLIKFMPFTPPQSVKAGINRQKKSLRVIIAINNNNRESLNQGNDFWQQYKAFFFYLTMGLTVRFEICAFNSCFYFKPFDLWKATLMWYREVIKKFNNSFCTKFYFQSFFTVTFSNSKMFSFKERTFVES